MPGHASLVAIGAMNSHNRYKPVILTLVRFDVIPGTGRAVMVLTTIGGDPDQLAHDSPDLLTLDLDAPARDMVQALANCGSAVMRSIFGGIMG